MVAGAPQCNYQLQYFFDRGGPRSLPGHDGREVSAVRTRGRQASGPAAGARSPRQSREDLRALLLAAGRSILLEEGLGAGAEPLTFKRAFSRLEAERGLRLTHASVIRRVWENQADYRADVLASIALDDGLGEFEETVTTAAALLGSVDRSTPATRATGLREIIRVGAEASMRAFSESPQRSLWIGVWALATTPAPSPYQERVRHALLEGYDALTLLWEGTYRDLMAFFGYRLRHGFDLRTFTLAVGALAEGCALRHRVDDSFGNVPRPTGPDGDVQPWTVFAIGFEALADQFFEPEPGYRPPDDAPRPPTP